MPRVEGQIRCSARVLAPHRHREPTGTENPQVQQNFPSKSAATELLFLQHCMAKLRNGGRTAIVLPDGILYRAETGFSTVRRRLINEFNVTAIVRLPTGVFPTASDTRTNLIFFRPAGRPKSSTSKAGSP